jgi:phage gpG-like protein
VAKVVYQDAVARKLLKDLEKNLKSIKGREQKFQLAMSPIVYRDIIKHFEQEQGPNGKWKEWSASYRAAINGEVYFRRIGGKTVPFKGRDPNGVRKDGMILQDTGRLRNSMMPTNSRATSQGIEWFNPAKTSSGFPYAYAHDTGGPKLPQRQFMWLSKKALSNISLQTLNFLTKRG